MPSRSAVAALVALAELVPKRSPPTRLPDSAVAALVALVALVALAELVPKRSPATRFPTASALTSSVAEGMISAKSAR
jgi:hypothetical protein